MLQNQLEKEAERILEIQYKTNWKNDSGSLRNVMALMDKLSPTGDGFTCPKCAALLLKPGSDWDGWDLTSDGSLMRLSKGLGRVFGIQCLHMENPKGFKVCGWKAEVYHGFVPMDFIRERTPNTTKYQVLTALLLLSGAENKPVTINALVVKTGLTHPQVQMCIKRCVRWGFVLQSLKRYPLIPTGSCYFYWISERGKDWQTWATAQGGIAYFEAEFEKKRGASH